MSEKKRTSAVETIVCPEDNYRPFKNYNRDNNSRKSNSRQSAPKRPRNVVDSQFSVKKSKLEFTGDVMDQTYKEIKELASTTLKGQSKKKFKDDILTKLGVPPPKEQTMPFKMKMGILQGREKREKRQEEMNKVSGVVAAKPSKKRKEWKKFVHDDEDFNLVTNKGFLHIEK